MPPYWLKIVASLLPLFSLFFEFQKKIPTYQTKIHQVEICQVYDVSVERIKIELRSKRLHKIEDPSLTCVYKSNCYLSISLFWWPTLSGNENLSNPSIEHVSYCHMKHEALRFHFSGWSVVCLFKWFSKSSFINVFFSSVFLINVNEVHGLEDICLFQAVDMSSLSITYPQRRHCVHSTPGVCHFF